MIKLEDIISKKTKHVVMKTLWPMLQSLGHFFDAEESSKEVTQDDWFSLSSNIKKGDVILSSIANNPGNLFLPGKAKHASIVTSADPRNPQLVEAVSSGVRRISLYTFMKNKSYLAHFRSRRFSEEFADKASCIAELMIGTPFDHVFSPSNNWLYCSEVVYESYKKAYLSTLGEKVELNVPNESNYDKGFPLKMKVRCGELTYIPDDIRVDGKNWEFLWSNTN